MDKQFNVHVSRVQQSARVAAKVHIGVDKEPKHNLSRCLCMPWAVNFNDKIMIHKYTSLNALQTTYARSQT